MEWRRGWEKRGRWTYSLAKGAGECEHGDCKGEVGVGRGGLDGELHAREEHSGSEADDEVEEDPGCGRGVHVEEVEQAAAERCQDPSGPDGPSVAAGHGDYDADDDRGRCDGEGLGEERDAGKLWSFVSQSTGRFSARILTIGERPLTTS